MTEREKVARIIEILGKARWEMARTPKCDECIAIKLNRAHILLGNLKTDYERYLD